jgi:hypothetical protein
MNYKIRKVFNLITTIVVFAVLFLYFWRSIDPRLIDFNQQPIFLTGMNFFSDYLVLPGGLAEYISLFISQFFHFALAGTILLLLVLYLILFLTRKLLLIFFPPDYVNIIQFIPVFLLAYLHSKYSYTLKPDIIILVSLLFVTGYHYFINKRIVLRIAIFVVSAAVSILFFGGVSLMLFSSLAIILEIGNKKGVSALIAGLYFIIAAIFIFVVGTYSPYMKFDKVMFDIFIAEKYYKPFIALYPLFLFYPALMITGLIFSGRMPDILLKGDEHNTINVIVASLISIIPAILLLITIRFSYDKDDKALIELNYYANNNDWYYVLKAGERLPLSNRLVLFQINRAMYFRGRLLDDLFNYDQIWGEDGLVLTRYYNSRILMPISDYYFDLGYIKESLHWANEALTKNDFQPDAVKRIALSYVILGEYKKARKYLNLLSKSLIYRKWARHYLNYLNNEDLITSDPLLRKKRELMPKHDYFANIDEPEADLYNLLQENPRNKMAFEYFIALLLLKHDIGHVVNNLHYLSGLNYDHIPRPIEEAVLLYLLSQGEKSDPQLRSISISKLTRDSFSNYNTILTAKYRGNLQLARQELSEKYRNTLWYYLHYISPITTKREIKERPVE